jgi:hypothetical protein
MTTGNGKILKLGEVKVFNVCGEMNKAVIW